MHKNKIVILVILLILTSISGCKPSNENIMNANDLPQGLEEEKEITIIMSNHNTMKFEGEAIQEAAAYKKHILMFAKEFTDKTGIKINITSTSANTQEEYLEARNTQLYLDGGPTLILIAAGEIYDNLVSEGVGLEVQGKIPNYDNIYDVLKDGYFVPMAIAERGVLFNKSFLQELNLEEPNLNWTHDDYKNIMYKYYENTKNYVSRQLINRIIDLELENMDNLLIDENNSKVATEDMVEKIENMKDYILHSQVFEVNEKYKYENYHNILLNNESEEYMETSQIWINSRGKDPRIMLFGSTNTLNSLETHKNYDLYAEDEKRYRTIEIENDESVFLPSPDNKYFSWGFIVNRNGKNVEEGLEFLDYLLSDEVQFKLYRENHDGFFLYRTLSFSAPVVQTIEEEITKLEKEQNVEENLINLRNEVLRQIKSGERIRMNDSTQKVYFNTELYQLLIKIIFSDEEYTSEEIMRELKDFDNRMNIMLNE